MAISNKLLQSATLISVARTTFLLVGIASTAFLFASIALPFSANLLSSSLPLIKSPSLSPSYLFITIHFIIIIIWKLHNHHPPLQNEEPSYIFDVTILPTAFTPVFDSTVFSSDPPVSGESEIDDSNDTIDATWKAILERGSLVRTRMSKSKTWERSPATTQEKVLRKSKTFRRVSVEKEELFGRAEAFIKTNYEQRRIQRQESEQRYIEMVNAAC